MKLDKYFKIKHGVIRTLLICTLLIFTACSEDFIELTPTTVIDKETFFSTDSELVIATNGVYAAQRTLYQDFLFFQMKDGRSDDVSLSQAEQPERVNTEIFRETPGNQIMVTIWNLSYNIINLSNAIIVNGADAEGDAALVKRAIAEAKFLRAMTYFEMTVFWGGLPLRLTPSENFDDIIVPTSAVGAVYDQIVLDLTEAAADLPASYDGSPGNEVGRATRYAAYALLGKVELQRGNNSAAETALREVLGNGELLSNYADVHTAGNDNSAESIYEIQFNPDTGHGLGFPSFFTPISETERLGITENGNANPILPFIATNDLIASFETGDPRVAETLTLSEADGTPYISKFIDLGASGNGHNVNLVQLRYADVLLMLAEAVGEGTEAYGYINQVRGRVGLSPIDATSPGTFNEKVLQERRAELGFEGHRWRDLLRLLGPQGTLSLMQAHLLNQLEDSFPLNDSDLLYPIPQSEVDISNGVVTQNPGY